MICTGNINKAFNFTVGRKLRRSVTISSNFLKVDKRTIRNLLWAAGPLWSVNTNNARPQSFQPPYCSRLLGAFKHRPIISLIVASSPIVPRDWCATDQAVQFLLKFPQEGAMPHEKIRSSMCGLKVILVNFNVVFVTPVILKLVDGTHEDVPSIVCDVNQVRTLAVKALAGIVHSSFSPAAHNPPPTLATLLYENRRRRRHCHPAIRPSGAPRAVTGPLLLPRLLPLRLRRASGQGRPTPSPAPVSNACAGTPSRHGDRASARSPSSEGLRTDRSSSSSPRRQAASVFEHAFSGGSSLA